MAVDVSSEIVIRRSRNDVAAYSANPDNAPAWYVNIKSVEWKMPPPSSGWFQSSLCRPFSGATVKVHLRDYRIHSRGATSNAHSGGTIPDGDDLYLESTADGNTHMTLRNRGDPAGFASLVAPLMSLAMRRANRKDLTWLRQLLEQ
jgi:polyketide cyclase/dehydrase/lipid transport protein